uniref:Uncharacterized protein n=1 Tax=viral metagenome TaxID=1070528 RepID=A0A6C0EQ76_9ZZZZ
MSKPLNIIIVEKTGTLKSLSIKDFKEDELYKKCGFKKPEDFVKQTEWNNLKYEGNKYIIRVFAKSKGKSNSENKYDFPPPIDTTLFFGNCAIVAYIKNSDGNIVITDLSLSLWNKIYEKLFGGFEDLTTTAIEDEEEIDELLNVPKDKKTKDGYLKDGFVVDSSDVDESVNSSEDTSDTEEIDNNDNENDNTEEDIEDDLIIDDIGSELSKESYDYDSDNDNK